jgi:hypothetical protein
VPSEFLPSSIIDPATGLPNNRADGDAQGWFTGFIEIVELHFEGPAQPPVEP